MGVLDRVFAAGYDRVMGPVERGPLGRQRTELLRSLSGSVVDVGAGTGANLPHLPAAVTEVTLVEPTAEMAAKLRQKLQASPELVGNRRVEVVEAPAEALPLTDASVDHVLATLVLCTVHDPARAIAEIRRVLRPGGTLVVLEHVAAEGATRRVQAVVQPVWGVVARGCHVDRDTRTLLEAGGFDTSGLVPTSWPGPAFLTTAIAGIATPRT